MRLRKRREGPLTRDQRAQFLASISRGSSVEAAARLANRSRQRFYEERQRNLDFANEWERALRSSPSMFVERREEREPGTVERAEPETPEGKAYALLHSGRGFTLDQKDQLLHQFGIGGLSEQEWGRLQREEEMDFEPSARERGPHGERIPRYVNADYFDDI